MNLSVKEAESLGAIVPDSSLESLKGIYNTSRDPEIQNSKLIPVLVVKGPNLTEIHWVRNHMKSRAYSLHQLDIIPFNVTVDSVGWISEDEYPVELVTSPWYTNYVLPLLTL